MNNTRITKLKQQKNPRGFISGEKLVQNVNIRIDSMQKREQTITDEEITKGITGKQLIAAVCERIDRFSDR